MSQDAEPPRKFYEFKSKDFERVNAPVNHDEPPPLENDVYAIRENLREREKAAGFDELTPAKPRKSRRTRDYWLTVISINVLMVALIVGSGFNLVVAVYAGSGMVLLTLGLTWTMWFIMDDY